ncbi:hypothetical protein BFX14_17715 [Vibrio cholerae]|nr:helix-turn-helix domain-containing protein [Vibrio cholerae]OFI74822.1 hypothetical protein BFX14_17715 [Vibrio cholerae]
MTITQMHPDDGGLASTVARRVRGLLGELDMDRKDLGPILGVSGSSASKRVRGDMPFALNELPVLASALDTTVEYLLGLTETRNPRRSAPGGGSFFVLPESGRVLRACRDSNPKPSDP